MFIRFLFAFLACIFFQWVTFAYSDDVLNEIEYRKYGTTYQTDSLAERLNRLEIDYFGMEQQGSIESRIDMLSKMSNNYRTSAIQPPVYYDNYPVKKRSAIRRFFDNLSDVGAMTGFTPSMTSNSFDNGSYYTSSGNRYGNSIPQRLFNNLLNQRNNYCPYHNNFHNNSYVNHRPYWDNNHNLHSHRHYNNFYNHNAYMPQQYYPQNTAIRNFYIPPNVQSRTSVKIIRD